jgi:ABC-type transport system substrate-binding protein
VIPRGSFARALAAGVALVATLAWAGGSNARAAATPIRTLDLSLPGPFNGCSILDHGATPTTNGVLDLIRPSAFLTSQAGNLYGEGGAIASAELTSLKPETVVYTLAANQRWSNGDVFDAGDLVAWWQRARAIASVQSDGYRDIRSVTESTNGLSLKVVFSQPYAEWNLLFRDVEDTGTPVGCSWSDFLQRPSLGFYKVVAASASRIVLVTNPKWAIEPGRFQRIVITDANAFPSNPKALFASYSLVVDPSTVGAVSTHLSVLSHIGTSSNIAEVTYSPRSHVTNLLITREALSWFINRQTLINRIFGAVTFSPSLGQSALYSQGQSAYPGGNGIGPSGQSTTTIASAGKGTGTSLADCRVCAIDVLRKAGFVKTAQGWREPSGVLLSVRMAVGPSSLDRAAARQVATQWRAEDIGVTEINAVTDIAAAEDAAVGNVDVAVLTRPTTTTASYSARSWSGAAYPDSYPSGVRTTTISELYAAGVSNFNPVTAQATWLKLDQVLLNDFWVRPLFTAPSLVEWSNSIATVYGSLSVQGLVDQVTGWQLATNSYVGS